VAGARNQSCLEKGRRAISSIFRAYEVAGPGGLRVPDCRAVQRRSAADRGHTCAAAEILIARRMLTPPVTGSAAGPGVTPGQERRPATAAETLSSLPAGRTSPGPERQSRAPTECTPAGMTNDL
jgi:hypothetical protein